MIKLKELDKPLPFSDMYYIAKQFGTDKSQYSNLYHEIMKDKRDYADIFEIGIYFGASLKMWQSYFKSGKVCGIDNGRLLPNSGAILGQNNENPSFDDLKLLNGELFPTNFNWLETERIKCAIGDQRKAEHVEKALEHFGINMFDFIVDDGHHFQEHQLKSLGLLFRNVKSQGYYIIEDVSKVSDLQKGSFWGQNTADASDSTDFVFQRFLNTGIFKSDYLSDEQCEFIQSNIDDVCFYDGPGPIDSTSRIYVLKMK